MSKYRKEQGDLEIIYGWDPALHRFYLVVEEREGELPEALVWSNLNLRSPGLSIEFLIRVIDGFGVRLTEADIEQLLRDTDARTAQKPWAHPTRGTFP